jgi:spore coat protein CotH
MKHLWGCLVWLACVIYAPSLMAQDIFQDDFLEIHIKFDDPGWREMLQDARSVGSNMRLNAEVKINNTVYRGVQARFKGNSSYNAALKAGYKKLPFNIKASDDQPFEGGYETLKLANNYRDPSAVRELLSYEIAGTYVPVPKCAFASV